MAAGVDETTLFPPLYESDLQPLYLTRDRIEIAGNDVPISIDRGDVIKRASKWTKRPFYMTATAEKSGKSPPSFYLPMFLHSL
jgi:hypothetical protein